MSDLPVSCLQFTAVDGAKHATIDKPLNFLRMPANVDPWRVATTNASETETETETCLTAVSDAVAE